MSGPLDAFRPALVISDVDGTLVNKAKEVTPATVDAVRRLEAAGLPFTVISARPVSGIAPIAQKLGIAGPVAAFNGGLVFRGSDGAVMEHHTVDPDVIRGMVELAHGLDVSTWIFAAGQWHADTLDNPHVPREVRSASQEPAVCPDMSAFYDRVDKLTFVSDDPALLRGLTERGKAAFGAKATVGQSQTYYLDVTATQANKGAGVTSLAHSYGVGMDRVLVLGDMYNDLPMFERAGAAIAMGQAPDDVKAKAVAVTDSNDQDGVAKAIDRYILPRLAHA